MGSGRVLRGRSDILDRLNDLRALIFAAQLGNACCRSAKGPCAKNKTTVW